MRDDSTEAIEVRDATLADASEVIRLFALLGHPQPAGDAAARLATFLQQGEHVLVASHARSAAGGPLLGALTLHVTPVLHRAGPIGRLTALVVDEAARGQGVGRSLVRAAEELFAARGCAFVEVTSNKRRSDAHAFYERLGYTATSFRFGQSLAPEE